MTNLFRRFLPAKDSSSDDEYSVEYSFAMEYTGPPVSYNIPKVAPVDVGRIPTAAAVPTASMVNNLSLPVIQPFVKSDHMGKKLSIKSTSELQADESPNSSRNSSEFDGSHVVNFSYSRGTTFRVVNVLDKSGELGLLDSDEFMPRLVNRYHSSGTLGFSDSHDDSRDMSESSDMERLCDDTEEGIVSVTASEITPCEGEESVNEAASPSNRLQVASFRDFKRCRSNGKKGACHRCLKGNRFTQKEVCIVCSAKYCCKCVLRAMGSMPEGRKCITCIGYRIDESKRATLGKSSRMLRHLLSDLRAKEIISCEISCEANQIPPELVYVNGKPLSHEELVELLSCANPPQKLKPRKYWYDKTSGLWGKEGERPCQIISPQLPVGGPIMKNASNGNTNILVNNREITKQELWMMQLAGIRCEGQPHFWLSADGSFQEEGQRNIIKKIWFKPSIRLACSVLSLPTPSETANSGAEEVDNAVDKGVQSNLERKTPYKLLLVGNDQSGTSTIFKQAKILYNVPFSEDERQNVKHVIQRNLYRYIGILLEEREHFEEEVLNEMRMKYINQPGPSDMRTSDEIGNRNIYSINGRLKAFSNWLLQVTMSGNLDATFPAAIHDYAPLVEELWKDRAFQATFNRRNEIQMLPRVANYFLDRAVEISKTDYEPSDMDILYAEGISSFNGITTMEFSFPKLGQDSFLNPNEQLDPLQRYQLIRVHASSLGQHCKWLEMFEDVELIIFCISLTDYDEFSSDINGNSTNKMLESKKLFETIATHPVCADKDFLLILNKFDLLEEKIEKVPLTQCEWFRDFNPVISAHQNSSSNKNPITPLAQRAFHYIASKFKRHFRALTGNTLYVSRATGLESDGVDEALKYGREVLKWDYERAIISMNELSSDSVEASTSS